MNGASLSEGGVTYVSKSAPTGSQAVVDLENTLPAGAFYGAVRLVVLGEGVMAKGAGDPLLAIARLREVPQNALVAAVKGKASSFVSSPSISSRKPIYFSLKGQSLMNSVLSGERLFHLVGNATTSNLAAMLPVFGLDQGLARFVGASVLIGGRERAFLTPNAATIVHPLIAAGPDTVEVSIPEMASHPLIFRARRAYADVTTLIDGSVRVSWHGEGRLDERETLASQGHSDQAIETGVARSIMKDLKGAVATLMQGGVDPREVASQPVATVAKNVHVVVHVHLDRGETGP